MRIQLLKNMLKLYRINDITLLFKSDDDFYTTKNMISYEEELRLGSKTDCEFVAGDTAIHPDAKLLFHKLPLSVYLHNNTVFRAFTPPLMSSPVAKTEYYNGKVRVTYKEECRDYVLRSDNMLNLIGFGEIAKMSNEFILHCSYIEVNGRAILFSGRSGIGKSTRASLWEKEFNSKTINGDKALLSIKDNNVYASGLPIAGSSGVFTNKTLSVDAIVFLGKAEENVTVRLDGSMAFKELYNNMIINNWNSAFCDSAAEFITSVIQRVPVYYSACNLSPASVIQQYGIIYGAVDEQYGA